MARLYTSGSLDTSFLDTAYNQFAGLINPLSFEPRKYLLIKVPEPVVFVTEQTGIHIEEQQVLFIKSGFDSLQINQRAHQQSRTD